MKYEKPELDLLESATSAVQALKKGAVLDSDCPIGNGDPTTHTACQPLIED
jgi:hypothetical protein